jgi:Protein of unknown function (DUF3592)
MRAEGKRIKVIMDTFPNWVATSATVTLCECEVTNGDSSKHYSFKVKYSYLFENNSFEGNKICPNSFHSAYKFPSVETDFPGAERFKEIFKVGNSIEIHVNPEAPNQSVIFIRIKNWDGQIRREDLDEYEKQKSL